MFERFTGIPYDEMPRYIAMYQEQLEEKEKQYDELSNTAMQLDKLVKEKQKQIDYLEAKINRTYNKLSSAVSHYKDSNQRNAVYLAMQMLKEK